MWNVRKSNLKNIYIFMGSESKIIGSNPSKELQQEYCRCQRKIWITPIVDLYTDLKKYKIPILENRKYWKMELY